VIFFTSKENLFIYHVNKKDHNKSVGGAKMANKKKPDENLKGSLYAVFGVGIIIILLWVYCFNLFIERF
jgi:hypothetical protein